MLFNTVKSQNSAKTGCLGQNFALRPREALLLFRDLNVKVLLFMAPNVKIVEVRTVFSP